MIALYIISGILIFFLLLMFAKLSIMISYVNDDLQVKVKLLLFSFYVYPIKEKEEKEKIPKAKKEKLKQIKKRPKPTPPIKETILLLRDLFTEIIKKFGRFVKLEEYRVRLLIATDDPAKTGVLYGALSGIFASINLLLGKIKRRTKKKGKIYTEIRPDFLAEEFEIFISVTLSMRLWQLFSVGITASKGFFKYNSLMNLQREKEIKKAPKENKIA